MDSRNTPDIEYSAPVVEDLGTLSEQTLTEIHKTGVTGDILVVNGNSIPIPGSVVVP
jgi:hypothetical protein